MVGWVMGSLALCGTMSALLPTRYSPTVASENTVPKTPSAEELQSQLAARELELRELRARLDAMDDAKWLAEANLLGVTALMSQAGFTERQARRVAIAIVREARDHALDPLLVVAVIRCESSSNPYAVSRPGAMGLMQVMPDTGRWISSQRGDALRRASNLYDPELNVELGTAYLSQLIGQFGNLADALIAYNAGPAAARRIIARRAVRSRFLNGYPMKVSRELQRLRGRIPETLARSDAKAPGEG